MSDDVEESAGESDSDSRSDREKVLADLREVREYARRKASGDGRLRDPDREKIRIKYLRTVIYSANAERGLLKDKDLDEMREDLEELLEDES